MTEKLIV